MIQVEENYQYPKPKTDGFAIPFDDDYSIPRKDHLTVQRKLDDEACKQWQEDRWNEF